MRYFGPIFLTDFKLSNELPSHKLSNSLITRIDKILQQDMSVATGAGHHGVIKLPNEDKWYIVYHRRPLNETDGNHRATCIDNMYFNSDGTIKPVKITFEGVAEQKLK